MIRLMSLAGVLAGGWLACSLATAAHADEMDKTEGDRCVAHTRVSRTEIIDSQTILFHMVGRDTYLNRLPRRCPGLRRNEALMFDIRGSRICDVDLVTVLQTWGVGFMPGASCRLGRFVPITEDNVKALRSPPRDIEPREVPGAEPEEIGSSGDGEQEQR